MRRPRIGIIDYGVGNLMSASKALELAGATPIITGRVEEALSLDALFLPGVGAFHPAMQALNPHQDVLKKALGEGKPLFGVCLGMELLFAESLEGGLGRGLGLFGGLVEELPPTVKRPHMGWNTIQIQKPHPILEGVGDGSYFYFVHSYYAKTETSGVIATTDYGWRFPVVVAEGKVFGTQFHPEKSGRAGLRILRNFIDLIR